MEVFCALHAVPKSRIRRLVVQCHAEVLVFIDTYVPFSVAVLAGAVTSGGAAEARWLCVSSRPAQCDGRVCVCVAVLRRAAGGGHPIITQPS